MLIFREYGAEPSRTNFHNGSITWTSRKKEVESCSSVSASSTTLIQNPTNCVNAKFIVTSLPKCGFGCQAHHAAFALHLALAPNRTLYVDDNAWYDVYLPVTTCSKPDINADVLVQASTYYTVGPMGPPRLTREWYVLACTRTSAVMPGLEQVVTGR